MNNIVLNFEQQKSRIEKNLEYIKQNLLKTNAPIFIELMGTPKSGKTTLLGALKNLFANNGMQIHTKQETAEYNPIEDKAIEEYNIWMFMELMKNLSEDLSDTTPRIIVYDRGMLDRLPWLDFSVQDGSIPVKDNMLLKKLYNTDFMQKYKPLSYGLVTSPELSVKRKGKPGRLVNNKNVTLFNECFEKEFASINSYSTKLNILKTDKYQDRLNDFIMDISETITKDISEVIQERTKLEEKENIVNEEH